MADEAVSNIANSTKETLTKKVGPLPIWAYAALGMGVLFIYSRNRRRSAPSSAASTEGAGFTDQGTGWMPSTVGLSNGYVPSTSETDAKQRTIFTNRDWIREAAIALAPGRTDNTQVLERLNQYLSGREFSPGDYASIIATAEEAIMKVGQPPPEPFPFIRQGAAPGSITYPNPTPLDPGAIQIPLQPAPVTGAPNNGQVRHFRVSEFGSLEAAAQHFFGDSSAWTNFYLDPSSPGTGDPNRPKGWINAGSYNDVTPEWILAVGPQGRIAD